MQYWQVNLELKENGQKSRKSRRSRGMLPVGVFDMTLQAALVLELLLTLLALDQDVVVLGAVHDLDDVIRLVQLEEPKGRFDHSRGRSLLRLSISSL